MNRFPRPVLLSAALLILFAVGAALYQTLDDRPREDASPATADEGVAAQTAENPGPAPRKPGAAEAPESGEAGSDHASAAAVASRPLEASDFEEKWQSIAPSHDFGLPSPAPAPMTVEERDGVRTVSGGREPLRFVTGWERPSGAAGGLARTWILEDPNLPKYTQMRVEQTVRVEPDGEVIESESAMVADHVIVKLAPEQTADAIRWELEALDAEIRAQLPLTGALLVAFDGAIEGRMERVLEALNGAPAVQFAEPDAHAELANYRPNDPDLSKLWGLDNRGQTGGVDDIDIDAPAAWTVTRGSASVIVGVIDTGIDYEHPDLAANMWVNAGETGVDAFGQDRSRNGADDDGNGLVDDVYGYDFVNNDPDPMDEHFHGTHVAGTIGAVGDNGVGVAGVTHRVKLIALKIFHTSGRSDVTAFISDVAESISYATDKGARVTNNSYGGSSTSQLVEDAIAEANAAGSLFVAAAGNSSLDMDSNERWPASYRLPNVITVAAVDDEGELASFSNFGANTVDLAAPGVSIHSTIPTQQYPDPYGLLSGTSMACPHTAGAAALLFAADPGLSVGEARQRLLDSVDPLPSLAGKTITGGHLNIAEAFSHLSLLVGDVSIVDDGTAGSTGDGDGILNPGETIAVSIQLSNDSEQAFTNVSATLDTAASDLANVISGPVDFGSLSPGSQSTGSGSFLIEITDDGLLPAVLNLPLTIATDQRDFQSTVLFEASLTRTLSGTVTVDGAGAPGAEIQWTRRPDPSRPARDNLANTGVAVTGPGGAYALELPDGDYEVIATFEDVESIAREITVPPSTTGVDFAYRRANVTGTVTDKTSGAPVAGVTIAYRGALEGEVVTDADGAYAIAALLPATGDLYLRASAPDYTTTAWKRVTTPPDPPAIDFQLGAPRMRVSATRMNLAAAQGASTSGVFTVHNEGDEALTFGVFNQDIDLRKRTSGIGRTLRNFRIPPELHNSLPYWPRNYGVAHDGESLWMVNGTHNLFRVSETNGALLETIPLELPDEAVPSKLTWDGRYFWMTEYLGRDVYCYDPAKESFINRWHLDAEDWPHFPAGITYARERLWIHRAPFLSFDFFYTYATFDPETGAFQDSYSFNPDKKIGRTHAIEFDNGSLWHGGTESDDSKIYRGFDDPSQYSDEERRDFVNDDYESTFGNVYDMGATRDGAFWLIGSTNNAIREDDNHISIALQQHSREIWLTQSPNQVTLAPGESAEISVLADASKIGNGAHAATMLLRSNDPAAPEQTVTLEFDVSSANGGNSAPVITASAAASPETAAWPANEVDLSVSASDGNGDELTYRWEKSSGPGTVSFSANETANADATRATFSAPGEYVLRVTISDGLAERASSVTVTISAGEAVSGTVTLDGAAATEAFVQFDGPASGRALVDADGGYSLLLPPGAYTLQARLPGAVASEPIDYQAGVPAPGFTFTTASLSGVVTGSRTGEPMAATVFYEWPGGEAEDTAGANGEFELTFVTGREAAVTLRAVADGLESPPAVFSIPPSNGNADLRIEEPQLDVSPPSLEVTASWGEVAARTLSLANAGDGPLRYFVRPRTIGEGLGRIAAAGDRLVWESYEVGWPFQYLMGMAYDGEHVYLGKTGGEILRLDRETGEILEIFRVPSELGMGDMTYDPDRDLIWFGDNGIGANNDRFETVYGVSPVDGSLVETVALPVEGNALEYSDGVLYVANQEEYAEPTNIIGYDLDTVREVSRISIGTSKLISWIAFHNGLLWWSETFSNAIRYADPFDGTRIGTVNQPYGSTFYDSTIMEDGTVWGCVNSDYVRWDTGQRGWLSLGRSGGVISPGESAPVDVLFDSAKAGLGAFAGEIIIRSNDPGEGTTVVPVTFTVGEPAQSISGTVTKDGQPVANATVKLEGELRSITTTNSAGAYSFAVGDGEYRVQARWEGWQAQEWRNVVVSGDSETGVDFVWTTGTVSGVVRESITDDPLPRAAITYSGAFEGELQSSGGNGSYSITHVYSRPSELQISARFEGTDHVAAVTVQQPGNVSRDLRIFGADLLVDPPAFSVQEQLADVTTRTLRMTNVGFERGLDWSLEGLGAIPWLSADVATATNQREGAEGAIEVTLTFTPSASPGIGTHTAQIGISTNDPNDARPIPVTLVVTGANDPPTVAITSPETDQILGTEAFIIRAEASDIDGFMDRIEFYANGQKIGEVANPAPGARSMEAVFEWTEASVGDYEIVARAVDDDGGFDEDAIDVQLTRNPVPVITTTRFPGGAPVTVDFSSENSFDPDGEIVDFRWDAGEPMGDLSLNDGFVVVEAEHIQEDHRQWDGSGDWVDHYYEVVEDPDASNGLAVRGAPNIGVEGTRTNLDPQGASSPPNLRWKAFDPERDKHEVYLWVRYRGPTADDNRLGLGFLGSFRFFGGPYEDPSTDYIWKRTTETRDSHSNTFNVRMEEDGILIDKLILTPSASFTPTGIGPIAETPGVWSRTENTSFTFAEDGEYTLHLTATDELGVTGTSSVTIVVGDPPDVQFSATPSTGIGPLPVNFDASSSTATNPIASYEWDFGDEDSTGLIDLFRPVQPYDPDELSDGRTEVDEQGELTLLGNVWTSLSYDYTVTPDTMLRFEYRGDVTGELHAIGLDNNDQHDDAARLFRLDGTGESRDFFLEPGTTYTGGDWQTFEIPVGDFYTGAMDRLVFVQVDAGFIDPASSRFRNPELVERARASGVTAAHTYEDTGDYVATLTVTDERGLTASKTMTISVVEPVGELPVISSLTVRPGDRVYEQGELRFAAMAEDEESHSLDYRWHLGGVPVSPWQLNRSEIAMEFDQAGNRLVRVQVRDGDGNVVEASLSITVEPMPALHPRVALLPGVERFLARRVAPGGGLPDIFSDHDGNGAPLLVEYFFNLDLSGGNRATALPHPLAAAGEDWVFRYERRADADASLIHYYASEDLADWAEISPSEYEETVVGPAGTGGETVEVALQGMASAPRLFVRTLVELPQIPFDGSILFEAEDGDIGGNWLVHSDIPQASGGQYIEINGLNRTPGALASEPNPENICSYPFFVPEGEAGTFEFWFKAQSTSAVNDSFFWRVDNEPWVRQNGFPFNQGAWRQANELASFELESGDHTLEITYREDGSKLDAFVIQQENLGTP